MIRNSFLTPRRRRRRRAILVTACAFASFAITYADAGGAPTPDSSSAPMWIFLRDKDLHDSQQIAGALSDFRATLEPEALRRRDQRGSGAEVSISDLPVASSYADAIAATGAHVRVESSWLNAISVQATPRQLAKIESLGFVDHVQPVARVKSQAIPEPNLAGRDRPATNLSPPGPQDFYGAASAQLNQIKIPQVHALGYTGAGVNIGILDAGFKRTHAAFNFPGHPIQVLAEHDFLHNTNDTSGTENDQHQHGTYVLSCIGAYQPNVIVGGAYDAKFILAKTEDVSQEVMAEEDYWVQGLQFLENHGADVVTSSLGYIDWYTQEQLDGHTAVTTIAAAAAAQRGLPITNAAGNDGHDSDPGTSHLIAPADADVLTTVGAVDSGNVVAGFSSDGPTADGRVKPEVMARGVDDAVVDAFDDTGTTTASGTSFATPLVASAVALLVQAHPDWSVDQIRYALFNTASRGGTFDPLYVQGYGVIDTLAAVQVSFDKFYTSSSSGSWDAGSNWTGGTAPINVSNVFITPANGLTITGPSAPTRVHTLSVDATSTGLTQLNLVSNATLTVDRSLTTGTRGQINQSAGTLVVNGTFTNNGTFNQIAGSARFLRILGNGTMVVGGRVSITPDGTTAATSRVRSLQIAGTTNAWTGRLDLADNDLVIDYAGASPIATVTNQIKTARNGGNWSGNGIATSLGDSIHALGVAESAQVLGASGGTFSGQGVDGSAVLVKYTYYGDTNLSGKVDFDDYVHTDNGFNNHLSGWFNGDFDYNGVVNFDDYVLIDLAFNNQSGTLARALSLLDGSDRGSDGMNDPALLQVEDHFQQFGDAYARRFLTAVPEPTMSSLGLLIPLLLTHRRRRRSWHYGIDI